MLEEHVTDLLPGYALGCLDEADLLKVARHLPHCAACRSELATYWAAADQLALAAPTLIPPPDLKNRMLQRVEQAAKQAAASSGASAQLAAPAAPEAASALRVPASPHPRVTSPLSGARSANGMQDGHLPGGARGWQGNSLLAAFRSIFTNPVRLAIGVLVLLIAFMGISNYLLWQRVNALQARVPQGNVQIVHLDGTNNAPLAQGYLMVFPNETYGTLVVENAPLLQPGYQYQLWLNRDGKRSNGGVFSVSDDGYGTMEVIAGEPLTTYQSFGITIEPSGGSSGPTGKKVLGGKL